MILALIEPSRAAVVGVCERRKLSTSVANVAMSHAHMQFAINIISQMWGLDPAHLSQRIDAIIKDELRNAPLNPGSEN